MKKELLRNGSSSFFVDAYSVLARERNFSKFHLLFQSGS